MSEREREKRKREEKNTFTYSRPNAEVSQQHKLCCLSTLLCSQFIHENCKIAHIAFYVAILCMHMNIISLFTAVCCRCSNNWSSSPLSQYILSRQYHWFQSHRPRGNCCTFFYFSINIWYFFKHVYNHVIFVYLHSLTLLL